ncbi:hypothetical protein BASA81_008090 [Batrachochytrium salamandrivorans]|nr:hypothetical protein BASA81_008090 [Batrachochytrium salamandrivorans]
MLPIPPSANHKTLAMSIPYACLHCNRNFATNGSLKTHIRTHTGEKPYECPDCHNRFAQLANCTRHIKLMHAEDSEDIIRELVRLRSLAKQARRDLRKQSSSLLAVCSPSSSSSSSPMAATTEEEYRMYLRFPGDEMKEGTHTVSLECKDFGLLEEEDEWSFSPPAI